MLNANDEPYLLGTTADYDIDGEDVDTNVEKQNSRSGERSPRKKNYCGDNYINADRFFLVASPLIFLVFNIVYWMSYGSQFYLAELDMDNDGQSG